MRVKSPVFVWMSVTSSVYGYVEKSIAVALVEKVLLLSICSDGPRLILRQRGPPPTLGRMSAHAHYLSDLVQLFDGETSSDDGAAALHAGHSALVQRIRDGDATAFEELVLSLSRPLEAYAYRFTGSRDAAKDLTQDVFAHLWEGRATLAVRGSVRGYLYAAVRNRALDVRKRENAEVARLAAVSMFGAPAGMAESSYDADAPMLDQEIAARVTAALNALPPRAREVALLRWRSGLGRAEIATVMGITISTVSNQLTLAARVVRGLLADLRDGV